MSDRERVNASEQDRGPEQIADGSIRTSEDEGKKDFLDIAALIRSIQRAEGNFDCFQRGHGYCDQIQCAWRQYCLESHHGPNVEKNEWV